MKCALFLSDFNETWLLSSYFWKELKCQNSSKCDQWESSCSMRTEKWTERRTDLTKLIVAFRNFADAPKNIARRKILPRWQQVRNLFWCVYDMMYLQFTFQNTIRWHGTHVNVIFLRLKEKYGLPRTSFYENHKCLTTLHVDFLYRISPKTGTVCGKWKFIYAPKEGRYSLRRFSWNSWSPSNLWHVLCWISFKSDEERCNK